jgi:hypothetical protein
MTCPRCHCRACRQAVASDRLRRFLVSRETPVDLPDEHAEQLAREVAALDFELRGG